MLIGTVWSCQIAGCYGLSFLLGTVGRGYVFGVKADSIWFALALNMHGKECGHGSVEWKKKEEEDQLEHKVSSQFRESEANLENFKCLQ